MTEIAGLRPKTYSYSTDDNDEDNKQETLKKCVQKKKKKKKKGIKIKKTCLEKT